MVNTLNKYITEESLDFALRHISYYYDTDFFPRTEEFIAIAHSWPEVRKYILDSDLDTVLTAPPLVEPWSKPKGGFRIVHRPEPIDSIIYAAFAQTVAPHVESARATPEVACSYRISITGYGFFSEGSGFNVYRQRNEDLAKTYPYVLTADISDFYNKIYLHRIQNALQSAGDVPEGVSKRIEHFLTTLNTKASQGIPVGPAASIIMSEATLIDADQFLAERGFEHVRYVDDFQIFSDDKLKLEALQQEFAVYLHENQRLSLSGEKTRIRKSEDFVREELNNQYQLEKLEILSEIEVVNPYTMEVVDMDIFVIEDAADRLLDALNRITKFETLDLGVIRAIVRRARAHGIKEIAEALITHLGFFAPAANDIFLYLDAVSDDEFIECNKKILESMLSSTAVNLRGVRLWLEWYYARQPKLLEIPSVKAFIFSSKHLRPQAQAAITLNYQSWIKNRKNQLLHYAYWQRRSILLAARILSKDEREKWLVPLLKAEKLDPMEKWMAKWVIDGCPAAEPPQEDFEVDF
jgi:hypothetical protein